MALNGGFTYRERIGPASAGQALLAHLASRYHHTPEEEWAARIAAGLVRLDAAAASPDTLLGIGQVVTWERPPWEEPEVPLHFDLLYEDESLVAVAKPSGLPTLPGGGFLDHTLLALVRRRFPEAAPAHRLGRGTSGLLLFTRTSDAGRSVSRAWRDHRVEKVYRALAEGAVGPEPFPVEVPIGPISHPKLGLVHAASPEGKPAHSEVRLLEHREQASLVEVAIRTGRPHQIRIHLAACGHPLVGDLLYVAGGGFRDSGGALPGDLGYHLHAWRIVLPHPATGQPLRLECPPPAPLRRSGEESEGKE